jgi:hypothetical protein
VIVAARRRIRPPLLCFRISAILLSECFKKQGLFWTVPRSAELVPSAKPVCPGNRHPGAYSDLMYTISRLGSNHICKLYTFYEPQFESVNHELCLVRPAVAVATDALRRYRMFHAGTIPAWNVRLNLPPHASRSGIAPHPHRSEKFDPDTPDRRTTPTRSAGTGAALPTCQAVPTVKVELFRSPPSISYAIPPRCKIHSDDHLT